MTSSAEEKFVVHDWSPHAKQRDKFLPLWLVGGSADAQRGSLGQPTGARPHLTSVPQTHLILIGELDAKTNRLDQLMRDALSAGQWDRSVDGVHNNPRPVVREVSSNNPHKE